MIFHLTSCKVWDKAVESGRFVPREEDLRDGFLHFSTAEQLIESTALYGRGRRDLLVLVVDELQLGEALKWEKSRKGMLFPHLYADLPMAAVKETRRLELDEDGIPIVPAELIEK